jgi:predicted TIM-barrel fold metal-dependent hydrolase
MNKIVTIPLLVTLLLVAACSGRKEEQYQAMTRIDAHVHIETADPAIMEFARSRGFKLLSICTGSDNQVDIDKQKDFDVKMKQLYPEDIAWLTTFSMEHFEDPGWADRVILMLQKDLDQGASGFKIWKDVGMTFRDSLGAFVFLDDPLFEPVLEWMQASGKTLLTHIGEPRNCWLPIDSMTVNNDKSYFRNNPQYHMYLHPDYPSYERLIDSRDHVLARYPGLKMVGAHLGSLEWDVDEIAERLDRYPNFAVDLAARVCHLQVQDREKVREFLIQYQDRILYATDFGITESNFENRRNWLENEWQSDWTYFATDSLMSSENVDNEFRGLALDEAVLRKIFYQNAVDWYPGAFD